MGRADGSNPRATGRNPRNLVAPYGEGGVWGGWGTATDPQLPSVAAVLTEAAPPTAPPRNEVWDACVEVLGYSPATQSEKRLWGKTTTSLRQAGATTDTIRRVAKEYKRRWPSVDLTLTALEKWYSHMLRDAEAVKPFKCRAEHCGLAFKMRDRRDEHERIVHDLEPQS